MRETREEKRRRVAAAVRLAAAAVLVATLFFMASALEGPPRASEAPTRAAVFAASLKYDEVVALFGDKLWAEQAAQDVFEEKGGSGTWNSTNATVKSR